VTSFPLTGEVTRKQAESIRRHVRAILAVFRPDDMTKGMTLQAIAIALVSGAQIFGVPKEAILEAVEDAWKKGQS
jgi:formaldehyde-activating enzyme involved in methanogenesis